MKFPAYTDDAYWTNVIEQYIQNNNKHPGWYNIEYYMATISLPNSLHP